VAYATFSCVLSHDLGIIKCAKGRSFLLIKNIDISMYTGSKPKTNNHKEKNILMKQTKSL
jgi:hypothetical protein